MTRIGADVGGTFTDVLLLEPGGRVRAVKVLSTPPDYDRAVVGAVRELAPPEVEEVVHGTTVATNAVLERRGAVTVLVTTEGFRDVLELRRMRMPHLYDYFWTKPPSLVPRHLRLEIAERVTASGEVLKPLDEREAHELAARIAELGPESVAVCLLHAHVHPEHERRLGEILRAELPHVPVTLSSEILREQQEYERTATTVVNAYVRPLMERYLGSLRSGLGAPLTIMQSSGGLMSDADAAQRPVYALESGPAAGVVAGLALARALGLPNVITFDMGGTTAKASLIEDGAVSRSQEYEVGAALSAGSRLLRGSGELIRIPTLDIAEVGAGGGSIAWVDPAGALHVGPRSAGASPGPACYGLGGEEPTVTDANVVLGYIPAGKLASGDLTVSRELAEAAVVRVGEAVGLPALDAARGICELANAATMRALRAVTTERGRDPGDFALLAYGGSGPIHAAALAAELGVKTAIVPPLAGLFSAAGLLFARPERHDVRFCKVSARDGDDEELRRLEEEMRASMDAPDVVEWQRVADVRYRGQSWSIPVEWPEGVDVAALVERFEEAHEQLYGTRLEEGSPVDVRALRLIALGPESPPFSLVYEQPDVAATRRADFGPRYGTIEVPVRSRAHLAEPVSGPLLIDEYDTTVVVPPGWTVALDAATGALVLTAVDVEPAVAEAHEAPIAVRLVANALETAADEMATTIFRTAHSAVVRDAMDYSAALCGPTAETIAQAVTIPLQLGSIPQAMATLLERFGGEFAPGDIYIVNDPFDGASHTPDIFVVKPSFLDGTLLGFAATIAHHADVGGRVPGSCACDSTEVFQEGLRLPWLRLYERGEPVQALFDIIRANVRVPHELLGDLSAQVAACHIGDRALQELARRYGAARLGALMGDLLDHTEALLRAEIAGWPDGIGELHRLPRLGRHRRLRRADHRRPDDPRQRPDRRLLALGAAGARRAQLHALLRRGERVPHGHGRCGRRDPPHRRRAAPDHGTDEARDGDARRPAGCLVYARHHRLPSVGRDERRALADHPRARPRGRRGRSTLAFFTGRTGGDQWVYSELVVGTWGGRPVADGNDGLANPCASMANIPVEVAETDWPIMIERYGLVPDSGGAGRYRGGLAVERVWRVLAPDTAVHVRSDRQVHRPYGLAGGGEGAPSSNLIVRADGTVEQMPPMFVATLQPGDVFHHRMPGGGGHGDPSERDPEAVARDVRDGKVSVETARELYGR